MFQLRRAALENHLRHSRRGVIVVLTAFLMLFFIILIAMAIDLGYIVLTRTELQSAADSTALAAAGALVNGTSAATTEGLKYLGYNNVAGHTISASNALLEYGTWNSTNSTFVVTNVQPNGVRVTLTNSQQPFFFGKVFGQQTFSNTAQAIAIYQPRDIALVLDYSGSMCYDSQFINMADLGRSTIEANLLQIYQELGSPSWGNSRFKWTPTNYGNTSTSNSTVKNYFGLTSYNYPYPDGSWDEYIDYVQTDSAIYAAGYRCDYGYMTFINYLLSQQPGYADTPDLWKTSEQPITAVKDAVDVLLSYLTAHSTDDQVAFAIYSYSDNKGYLEQGLTKTYTNVSSKVRQRQAGHYVGGTNISGGMNKGRLELQNNARIGAKKMMVLMTDGVVNLPTGNTTTDKASVITEANLCAAANIPVVSIALGAEADTALMQQIATITGGAYFEIQGGQTVAQVKSQLEAIFGQVAADRPLKLVQ